MQYLQKITPLDKYLDLITLILPQFLVDHLGVVNSKKEKEALHLYLKNVITLPRMTPP